MGFAAFAVHAQSGREIFESGCATCHGSDGRGRSQAELGFETPPPDFTDCDFAAREPDLDWTAIIHDGGPARAFNRIMPAFGDALDDTEIRAALEHARSFCTNPDWPRGDLNLPRPLFTEKAFPEDEAVIETTLDTVGDDSVTFNFLWEQRFGTRNQMEISLPLSRADLPEGGSASGAGDLAVGVKHVVHHSYERGSILSIGGEVVLPTGDEAHGFGKGTTVFEPYVAFGKVLPRNSFVQVQAKAEFPSSSSLADEYAVRGGLGRTFTSGGPFGRAWTPIVEVLGAREQESGAKTQWDLVPQLQVSLSRRQHILASAGLRLPVTDRSERDPELVMYLLWDWFDGGVFEGW
jgi:Cytochrome C oxidase, cbb3-type, subunit III/Putative MetA-pathway of phenol degradation